MTDHHVKLLRELGFPLDRQGQKKRWNVMYNCLVDFHKEHGHFVVPRKGEALKLSDWVARQRSEYKNFQAGKKFTNVLSEEQIKTLESIGFVWNPQDEAWNTRYKELKEYSNIHGNVSVKKKDNSTLFKWVHRQHDRYNTIQYNTT